ncbi:hypothetical protein DFJ73DRAFT_465077 [Zopfochytrium polystomum]|nr:hypothetical protein DFJ73DRAFT_465077 [Zopfochytrium polystomum]
MRIVNPQQRLKLQEKEFSKMEKGQDNLDLLEVDSILFTFDRRPESKGVRVSTRGPVAASVYEQWKKAHHFGNDFLTAYQSVNQTDADKPEDRREDGNSFTKGGKPKSNVDKWRTEVKDMVLGKINMERARADLSALMTYPTKGLLDGSACIHFSGVPNGMNMAKWVQWTKLELDELNAAIRSGNFRVTLGSNNNLMDLWEALCVGDVLEDQTQLQTNGPSIALNFVKEVVQTRKIVPEGGCKCTPSAQTIQKCGCNNCDEDAGHAHRCPFCGRHMLQHHGICCGEESYSRPVICPPCQRKYVGLLAGFLKKGRVES